MTEIYKGVDYSWADRPPDRRFKPDRPRKTWQVGKIWDSHAEIIRRITLGQKNTEIAQAMNLTQVQVSSVRNSEVVKDKLAIMQGARDAYTIDIAKDIQEFAPKALELLKNIVLGQGNEGTLSSPVLKASVAKDLLDRAGFAPVKKVDFKGVHAHLTREDIEAIKQRAFEGNGPIVLDAQRLS